MFLLTNLLAIGFFYNLIVIIKKIIKDKDPFFNIVLGCILIPACFFSFMGRF